MKIINIGILAHVDAGKTTLTESLLYTSGAILELGSVDKGTTRTDTMFLERQRGITIQAAVTSFNWNDYKINIVDTPGHTDFITEVYRSLSVLDGAILVISAKDGVQAQTRILFHALQKMNIPTIIFINKIDQDGINLNNIYQNIKEKLSNDIIVMQNVTLTPEISIKSIIDLDDWDPVISRNDKLLKKYSIKSTYEHFVLDALSSAMCESLCDIVSNKLCENKKTRPRFSVGYGDLSLEYQKQILDMLDAKKYLNLTLLQSFLMVPTKSITAIIGIENGYFKGN